MLLQPARSVYVASIIYYPLRRVDDVARRRGYSDHFVTMYVWVYVGVYVSTIKRKPLSE